MEKKEWTKDEENYLKNNYSDLTTDDLAKKLNRTNSSISKKLFTLKLKKSKEHRGKMIGKRNKMVGRDLTYNLIKDIAQKYKTRGEFQQNDSSAYSSARRNGYLEDVCKHMIKNQYSIPQLILGEIVKTLIDNIIIYNDRKTIKPYELDVFVPKYNIAFEYDGKGWHLDNKNDIIKNELCEKKDIKLIRIIENSRKYIDDIKNQLINKIDDINNHCNLDIKKEDILNISVKKIYDSINHDLLDSNDIKGTILKYTDFSTFKKDNNKLYQKLIKMKRLDEFTKDLKRDREIWNDDKIKKEISKYDNLLDFIENSNGCYIHIKRNNLGYMLNNLKRKNTVWNIDDIKKIISKHNIKTVYQLKKLYPSSVKYLRKNDLIQDIRHYMENI